MKKLSELELEILNKIKPSRDEYELIWGVFSEIREKISGRIGSMGIDIDVSIQGSIAHDTWLRGDRDIDVFVLFPGDWSREDIEKKAFPLLLEVTRDLGHYELRYAEHPYVRLFIRGIEVDIVPGLRLQDPSQAKTAVDRTPFHTRYLNNVLTNELRDHVRLLKRFMKTIGVYGAEVKIRGFSGYAVELLVVTYGGFRGVLENASTWKPPVFVNTLGDRLTDDLIKRLRSRYPDSHIYMPDPVDPLRNVTASVSLRSLALFILASKCYLRNPDRVFFEEMSEPYIGELVSSTRDRCIIVVEYRLREVLPPDVIWGEIQRVASRLVKLLGVLGVRVLDYSTWSNEKDLCLVSIELENCILSRYKHYTGPCIHHGEDRLLNFIHKHYGRGLGPWVSNNGCLEAINERSDLDIRRVIETRAEEYTVSPHLKLTKPSIYLLDEEKIRELIREGGGRWLRDFIQKTPIWMEKCISWGNQIGT